MVSDYETGILSSVRIHLPNTERFHREFKTWDFLTSSKEIQGSEEQFEKYFFSPVFTPWQVGSTF